jgi:DNA primase
MKQYLEIIKNLNVDEFEAAIGFEPIGQSDSGEDWGHCPDPWSMHKHGDRTGKFSINRDKKVFNCFVCGGGTLLSLAMAIKDCTESDAIEWLWEFSSKANQSDESFLEEIGKMLADKDVKESESLPWFNQNVLTQWKTQDHEWFSERGIVDFVIEEYNLGVNHNTLRSNKTETFESTSIVLPHFWDGKLVGWQNRWIGERPKWVPKYTNTGDFPKKTTLYGFDQAIRFNNPVVVVESVPSVLYLASLGIPAVATFGANVSKEQMMILRGFQEGIILARDNDSAGLKWSNDLSLYLERYIPVMEMEMAWEDDIAEPRMVENPEVTIGLYNNPVYSLIP